MDKTLKILAAIGMFCASLACLAFVWESYRRYALEQTAAERCVYHIGLDKAELVLEEEKAAAWLAVRDCVIGATKGRGGDPP